MRTKMFADRQRALNRLEEQSNLGPPPTPSNDPVSRLHLLLPPDSPQSDLCPEAASLPDSPSLLPHQVSASSSFPSLLPSCSSSVPGQFHPPSPPALSALRASSAPHVQPQHSPAITPAARCQPPEEVGYWQTLGDPTNLPSRPLAFRVEKHSALLSGCSRNRA